MARAPADDEDSRPRARHDDGVLRDRTGGKLTVANERDRLLFSVLR